MVECTKCIHFKVCQSCGVLTGRLTSCDDYQPKIVRCKDCWKRYDIDECPMCVLHITSYFEYTADDGFCDRGELRSHHDSLCDQTEEGEA